MAGLENANDQEREARVHPASLLILAVFRGEASRLDTTFS